MLGPVDRWAEADPEYDGHGRLAAAARRPAFKWVALLIAWVIVTGLLAATHLEVLIWVIMIGLIGYVVYAILRDTPRATRPRRRHAAPETADPAYDDGPQRFNPPPGWPEPPPGWTPPPGWQPNPAWPPAPPGWQFWLPPDGRAFVERSTRTLRPQGHRSGVGRNGHRRTDLWR